MGLLRRLSSNEREKWIDIDITVMIPYSELIKTKAALKPYAEELGWKIISSTHIHTIVDSTGEKEEEVAKLVNVTLYPRGGTMSPIKFLSIKEKLLGLVFSIHRDVIYDGDEEEAVKNFTHTISITCVGDKSKKENYTIRESIGPLNYYYKLIDRIKLEKSNEKLALELFGETVEQSMKSIFDVEQSMKSIFENASQSESEEMKENIKKLFGFNID